MTLSDPFCVDRHRDAFLAFIADIRRHPVRQRGRDLLALPGRELRRRRRRRAAQDVRVAALTRSEKGSVIATGSERRRSTPSPREVVDTTGAGDLYAAGFLFGYTNGASLERAARMGSICAAEVISHLGARPRANLRSLIAEQLG